MSFSTRVLPNRLKNVPFHEWVPSPGERESMIQPALINAHAHHDTNPWGWDGLRVAAEMWRRGVARFAILAFDNGSFIDSIGELSDATGVRIPCFIEALVLTPGEGEVWNDLPGRMYIQAGPFFRSEEARRLSDALTRLARKRAEYQVERWNEGLDLGFEYRPDWTALEVRGVTEANLSREIVERIRAASPHPDTVWRQIPGLSADPGDPNFARAFRNATMVADDAVAKVPRTREFFLTTEEFIRLADGAAYYMYVGRTSGVEANREALVERMKEIGLTRFCAIPERNVDTAEHEAEYRQVQELLVEKEIPTLIGTELNAAGQWWAIDLREPPFAEHGDWLAANYDSILL